MRDTEKDFLSKKSKYVMIKEVGDEFVGTFKKVLTTPITKSINGVEDSYLRYILTDEDGEDRFLDVKSTYKIKALSKFIVGDVIRIKVVERQDEKNPDKTVKRWTITLADNIPVIEEGDDGEKKPVADKDIPF